MGRHARLAGRRPAPERDSASRSSQERASVPQLGRGSKCFSRCASPRRGPPTRAAVADTLARNRPVLQRISDGTIQMIPSRP